MLAFRDLWRVYFRLLWVRTLQTPVIGPGGNLNCLFVSAGLFAKFVQFSERLFFSKQCYFFLYKPLTTQTLCFLGNLNTDWISLILSLFLYHHSPLFFCHPIIFLNNSLCCCAFLLFSMTCFPPLVHLHFWRGSFNAFYATIFVVFEHMWQVKCQIVIVYFVIPLFPWMMGTCINEL